MIRSSTLIIILGACLIHFDRWSKPDSSTPIQKSCESNSTLSHLYCLLSFLRWMKLDFIYCIFWAGYESRHRVGHIMWEKMERTHFDIFFIFYPMKKYELPKVLCIGDTLSTAILTAAAVSILPTLCVVKDRQTRAVISLSLCVHKFLLPFVAFRRFSKCQLTRPHRPKSANAHWIATLATGWSGVPTSP
jgi:hypothetical protein